MTSSPKPAWFVRPRVIVPLLLGVVLLSALFTRTPVSGRNGDPRLSTYSTDPQGAKLFAEFAERSGWRVERAREAGFAKPPAGTTVVHAELSPDERVLPADVHDALSQVREGGRLLLVLGTGTTAFSDSLGIEGGPSGDVDTGDNAGSGCRRSVLRAYEGLWPGSQAYLQSLTLRAKSPLTITDTLLAVHRVMPADSVPGKSRVYKSARLPAMMVATLGRGRVVVAADPDVLRNDALRVCSYGIDIGAARALAALTPDSGGVRTLRVDEYHHGYGLIGRDREGVSGAVHTFLADTAPGRAIAQLLVAALLLLFAMAPRGVAPVDPVRVERRSPFEHVDALARAYAQVGATRTATARLVRGLRRRTERSASRAGAGGNEQFLQHIVSRYPAMQGNVERIQHALADRVTTPEFLDVGDAVARIEQHLLGR